MLWNYNPQRQKWINSRKDGVLSAYYTRQIYSVSIKDEYWTGKIAEEISDLNILSVLLMYHCKRNILT